MIMSQLISLFRFLTSSRAMKTRPNEITEISTNEINFGVGNYENCIFFG